MRGSPDEPNISLVAGVVLMVGLTVPAASASAFAASTGAQVADDQPLPPYTIDNPPLPPLTVGGASTVVRQGVHHHAAYDIEVRPAGTANS